MYLFHNCIIIYTIIPWLGLVFHHAENSGVPLWYFRIRVSVCLKHTLAFPVRMLLLVAFTTWCVHNWRENTQFILHYKCISSIDAGNRTRTYIYITKNQQDIIKYNYYADINLILTAIFDRIHLDRTVW